MFGSRRQGCCVEWQWNAAETRPRCWEVLPSRDDRTRACEPQEGKTRRTAAVKVPCTPGRARGQHLDTWAAVKAADTWPLRADVHRKHPPPWRSCSVCFSTQLEMLLVHNTQRRDGAWAVGSSSIAINVTHTATLHTLDLEVEPSGANSFDTGPKGAAADHQDRNTHGDKSNKDTRPWRCLTLWSTSGVGWGPHLHLKTTRVVQRCFYSIIIIIIVVVARPPSLPLIPNLIHLTASVIDLGSLVQRD